MSSITGASVASQFPGDGPSGRSDLEVAGDFVSHVRSAPDAAESALLAEAFEAVRLAEANR